jgi:hypothetical protein
MRSQGVKGEVKAEIKRRSSNQEGDQATIEHMIDTVTARPLRPASPTGPLRLELHVDCVPVISLAFTYCLIVFDDAHVRILLRRDPGRRRATRRVRAHGNHAGRGLGEPADGRVLDPLRSREGAPPPPSLYHAERIAQTFTIRWSDARKPRAASAGEVEVDGAPVGDALLIYAGSSKTNSCVRRDVCVSDGERRPLVFSALQLSGTSLPRLLLLRL